MFRRVVFLSLALFALAPPAPASAADGFFHKLNEYLLSTPQLEHLGYHGKYDYVDRNEYFKTLQLKTKLETLRLEKQGRARAGDAAVVVPVSIFLQFLGSDPGPYNEALKRGFEQVAKDGAPATPAARLVFAGKLIPQTCELARGPSGQSSKAITAACYSYSAHLCGDEPLRDFAKYCDQTEERPLLHRSWDTISKADQQKLAYSTLVDTNQKPDVLAALLAMRLQCYTDGLKFYASGRR